jgi:hypothetical protein
VKNYLIKGLHRIGSKEWWPGSDRSTEETIEGDLYYYYEKMARLSEASFFHNLQGDWEYIKLESTATDVNHVFRQQFRAIWNIWSTEPCNIYYCGSDVQVLKPVEVFGRYKHFLLFNYTDPKSLDEYEHFLNADIRYYPAEMDRAMFENALDRSVGCTYWNGDQKLYNRMVWGQGLAPEQVIDPTMAYQGPWLPSGIAKINGHNALDFANLWNGCTLEEAKIVHWHGSRHAPSKLQLMQSINDQLGIPDVPVKARPTKTIDISHLP